MTRRGFGFGNVFNSFNPVIIAIVLAIIVLIIFYLYRISRFGEIEPSLQQTTYLTNSEYLPDSFFIDIFNYGDCANNTTSDMRKTLDSLTDMINTSVGVKITDYEWAFFLVMYKDLINTGCAKLIGKTLLGDVKLTPEQILAISYI
jgi:hypothetical protein